MKWATSVAALIAVLGLTSCAAPGSSTSGAAGMQAAPVAKLLPLRSGKLAYLKAGAGPAVVIVHGVGGHKEDWQATIQRLAPTHTVYAIDMLGFGGSSKDLPVIEIGAQVDALKQLLDSEQLPAASLIGNSVGGWVAAGFAATHPQRTKRLVLVDAAGFKAMFDRPSPVNFDPGTVEEMQTLLKYVVFSETAHTRAYAERALAAHRASGDSAATAAVFKGLFASPRLEDLMPSIQAPTLVVWGAEDRLFPPVVADLVQGGIKGSRKQLIPAAGHFPQLDQPEAFNDLVVGFLTMP